MQDHQPAEVIPDTVDCTGKIIRDEQRTVFQHGDIHKPTEILTAFLIQPAVSEDDSLISTAFLVESGKHETRSEGCSPNPGTVLSGKDAALIFLGKHLTRVEHHSEICDVGILLDFREHRVRKWFAIVIIGGAVRHLHRTM